MIKRILIDTNAITIEDGGTGIQRVIKKIIVHLTEKCVDVEIIPFNNHTGRCTVSKKLLDSLIPHNKFQFDEEITLKPGDYIINPDMIPGVWKGYFHFYTSAKKLGIPVAWVCHDLIPYYYQEFWESHVVNDFIEMVDVFFNDIADNIICVSKTVADDQVLKYFKQIIKKPYPNISYWHLGSDFKTNLQNTKTISSIKDKEYLLMVGTVEPRKNHKLAIEAMDKLWQSGSNLCLVIAGKIGWLSDEMFNFIINHPEFNKKLFYLGHVTDDELVYCYNNCKALLQLSTIEGFGLPLIEASYHGAEIICSDIPVFREVAGEYANYVSLDPIELSNQIHQWHTSGIKIDSKNMPRLSWSDSCDKLIDIIFNDNFYLHGIKKKGENNTFYGKYYHQTRLRPYENKVYSQNGEDGIIQYIFNNIGTTNKIAVEVGVSVTAKDEFGNYISLKLENNTAALAERNWKLFWFDIIDPCIIPPNCTFVNKFLTKDNIVECFEQNNIPKEFDLLSIDIDSNDYYLRESLKGYSPRVVISEYNGSFDSKVEFIMPYDENYVWPGEPDTNYGVSLTTLTKQANELGYDLVYCESKGVNAFFVRKDINVFRVLTPDEAWVRLHWA